MDSSPLLELDASVNGDHDVELESDADAPEETEAPNPLLECGYPEDGYGFREGRALNPFALWDCDGEETSLPRLWCDRAVTIIHISVAYCGICQETIDGLNQMVQNEFVDDDIAFVEVLIEALPGVKPGLEECRYWSESFDPPVTTYIPPDEILDGPLLRLADSDAVPFTVVVDDSGIVRIWSAVTLPPDFVERVKALLD